MYIIPDQNKRELRVFVSSTFADMQAERDYLVKKTFPAIEQECRARNVRFTALDLRWGITEEESTSGKVVEICLDEIERSRPFFIGIVGGRYGSVPDKDFAFERERIFERFVELKPYFDENRSITEIEMLYGALTCGDKVNANFFLRRERAIPSQFRENDADAANRLNHLRTSIKECAARGECRATEYSTPRELGRKVYEQLMELVEACFPVPEYKNVYAIYAAEQMKSYAELQETYVERHAFEFLDKIADDNVLLIHAPRGAGLSAFFANELGDELDIADGVEPWAVIVTQVNADIFSEERLMRLFLWQMRERHPEVEIPEIEQDDSVSVDFLELYARFPQRRVLWVIDGADRLADIRDRMLTRVREMASVIGGVLIGTGDGPEAAEMMPQQTCCRFPDITASLTRKIAEKYLGRFRKRLSETQMSAVVASPVIDTPRMLMVFLDAIVTYGNYRKLNEYIHSLLSVKNADIFYGRILDGIEADNDAGKVRRMLGLLSYSFTGMDEHSLLEGLYGSTLERMALLDAIRPFCTMTFGKLKISDERFLAAVRSRYNFESIVEDVVSFRRRIIAVTKKDNCRIDRRFRKNELAYRIGKLLARMSLVPIHGGWEGQRALMNIREMLLQYMALDDLKGVADYFSHMKLAYAAYALGPTNFGEASNYLVNKRYPVHRLMNSFDLWLMSFADLEFMLVVWLSIVKKLPGESLKLLRRMRYMPVSGRVKALIRSELDCRRLDLETAWDENDPDSVCFIAAKLGGELSNLMFRYSKDKAERVQAKAMRTMATLDKDSAERSLLCAIAVSADINKGRVGMVDKYAYELRLMPLYYMLKCLDCLIAHEELQEYAIKYYDAVSSPDDKFFALIFSAMDRLPELAEHSKAWKDADLWAPYNFALFLALHRYPNQAAAIFSLYDDVAEVNECNRFLQLDRMTDAYLHDGRADEALEYMDRYMSCVADGYFTDANLYRLRCDRAYILYSCGRYTEVIASAKELLGMGMTKETSWNCNLHMVWAWSIAQMAKKEIDTVRRTALYEEGRSKILEVIAMADSPMNRRYQLECVIALAETNPTYDSELEEIAERCMAEDEFRWNREVKGQLFLALVHLILRGKSEEYLPRLQSLNIWVGAYGTVNRLLRSDNSDVIVYALRMFYSFFQRESQIQDIVAGDYAGFFEQLKRTGRTEDFVGTIMQSNRDVRLPDIVLLYGIGKQTGREELAKKALYDLKDYVKNSRSAMEVARDCAFMELLREPTEDEVRDRTQLLFGVMEGGERVDMEMTALTNETPRPTAETARAFGHIAAANIERAAFYIERFMRLYDVNSSREERAVFLEFVRTFAAELPKGSALPQETGEKLVEQMGFTSIPYMQESIYSYDIWKEMNGMLERLGLSADANLLSYGMICMPDELLDEFYKTHVNPLGYVQMDVLYAQELSERGKHSRAIEVCNGVLKMDGLTGPDKILTLIRLAREYRAEGNYGEGYSAAKEAYRLVDELMPHEQDPTGGYDIFVYLTLMILVKDFQRFEETTEAYYGRFENDDRTTIDLMRCVYYLDVDNERSARRLLEKIPEEMPEDVQWFKAWVYAAYAAYCRRHGRTGDAAVMSERAKGLLPADENKMQYVRRILQEL